MTRKLVPYESGDIARRDSRYFSRDHARPNAEADCSLEAIESKAENQAAKVFTLLWLRINPVGEG